MEQIGFNLSMEKKKHLSGIAALEKGYDFFHPGFSVDCVILGFHNGILKILLTKFKGFDKWMLPGSFVFKDEDVDTAAYRILKDRTGLDQVFLKQFYLFGDFERKKGIQRESQEIFKELYEIHVDENHWFSQRFITIGYYALVDFSKVHIDEGAENESIQWHDLNTDIAYYEDHKDIALKAIETIRLQLNLLPVGIELLPDRFTMPELRSLYETLLGRPLDRRNFQRRILSFGYVEKLNERRKGGAHKAPNLYIFSPEKYKLAQEQGIESGNW